MIKVVIVDDHKMTRLGIKSSIEKDSEITVVGEAQDGKEAISLCAALNPHIVLMDVIMPNLDGIEATKAILEDCVETKVIMLSSSQNESDLSASLKAGAKGYCFKDIDINTLIDAIHSVADGDIWLDSELSNFSIPTLTFGLSEKEMLVMDLVVQGATNKQIASALDLSIYTIRSHLKTIMSKLEVNDRTQAAVKVARKKIFCA